MIRPMNNFDHFYPKEFVKDIGAHKLHIERLNQQIKILEDKFGDNEKIAKTLYSASKTAVQMQTLFAELFIKSLKSDDGIKDIIKKNIRESDRNYMYALLSRFGWLGTIVISVTLGSIGTIITQNILN